MLTQGTITYCWCSLVQHASLLDGEVCTCSRRWQWWARQRSAPEKVAEPDRHHTLLHCLDQVTIWRAQGSYPRAYYSSSSQFLQMRLSSVTSPPTSTYGVRLSCEKGCLNILGRRNSQSTESESCFDLCALWLTWFLVIAFSKAQDNIWGCELFRSAIILWMKLYPNISAHYSRGYSF